MGLRVWGADAPRKRTSANYWLQPARWCRVEEPQKTRARVFCGSLCDVMEDRRDLDPIRSDLWRLIDATRQLDWLLLTKRPENYPRLLPDDWGGGRPNVWLGTTIEDGQACARGDALRAVPAIVRFISYEPALGPLDGLDLDGLDWIIYGGESGPRRRPEDKDWARSMRDRCRAAAVAFFHKQSAHLYTERGVELDGEIIHEVPTPRAPPCAP